MLLNFLYSFSASVVVDKDNFLVDGVEKLNKIVLVGFNMLITVVLVVEVTRLFIDGLIISISQCCPVNPRLQLPTIFMD